MDSDFATLKYLIDETPAARSLIQSAHLAAKDGHPQAAWIILAAVADAMVAQHPGVISIEEGVTLRDLLSRYFTNAA